MGRYTCIVVWVWDRTAETVREDSTSFFVAWRKFGGLQGNADFDNGVARALGVGHSTVYLVFFWDGDSGCLILDSNVALCLGALAAVCAVSACADIRSLTKREKSIPVSTRYFIATGNSRYISRAFHAHRESSCRWRSTGWPRSHKKAANSLCAAGREKIILFHCPLDMERFKTTARFVCKLKSTNFNIKLQFSLFQFA